MLAFLRQTLVLGPLFSAFACGASSEAEPLDAGLLDGSLAAMELDGGAVDAAEDAVVSPRDAAPWDAGVPSGTIPMFVAFGHRGRTLVSCNGTDWVGEHVFGGKAGDHGPYAALGRMAYGDGKFIGCSGWGDPIRLLYSENGVDWDDLPDTSFQSGDGLEGRPRSGCAGIGWDGKRFAAASGGRLYTSTDGRRWQRREEPLPGTGALRNFRGGSGLLAYVRSGVPYFSSDAGESWYTGSNFDPECGERLQRGGGILFEAGQVVIVGQGRPVCVSNDRGRTFFPSNVPKSGTQALAWDGSRYLAGGQGSFSVSSDGRSWGAPIDLQGFRFSAIGHHADLGYVAVDRNGTDFLHSLDGIHWSPARYDGNESDWILSIVAGFGTPSALCRGR